MAWTTDIWPNTWEKCRSDYQRAVDCYNALKEREKALGYPLTGPYPYTPPALLVPTYRNTRACLVNYKQYIKYAILTPHNRPAYVNASLTVYTPQLVFQKLPIYGIFENYDDFAGFPIPQLPPDYINYTSPVFITLTNYAEFARIPKNFLDYTPYRALNSLGHDKGVYLTEVGHNYGWETEETKVENSGTFFPNLPSIVRTKWFTTDYFWENLYKLINILILTTRPLTKLRFYDYTSGAGNYNGNSTPGFVCKIDETVDWHKNEAYNSYATLAIRGAIDTKFQMSTWFFNLRYFVGDTPKDCINAVINSLTGHYRIDLPTQTSEIEKNYIAVLKQNAKPDYANDDDNLTVESQIYDSFGQSNVSDTATEYSSGWKTPTFHEFSQGEQFLSMPTFPPLPNPVGLYDEKYAVRGWKEDRADFWIDWNFTQRLPDIDRIV